MTKYAVVVGKFYPLHIGHINLIQQASTIYDKVIVIVSHHESRDLALFDDSKLKRPLTGKDKLVSVQKTFQMQRELIIPVLVDESDVPNYPNGWSEWSKLVKETVSNHHRVPDDFDFSNATFCINEQSDVENYQKYFSGCKVSLFDAERNEVSISATEIRNNPVDNWDYIARSSRELLTPTIAIVGGESSGKTIMTDRLAQYWATTSVWEKGRTITEEQLGGDETALQYKDYADISAGHYQDLKFALIHANKVVFSDTDFITTQAFSIVYEGRPHPSVQEKIDNVRFDLTIMLNNNVKWVADGMRMLGEDKQRQEFQELLKSLYKKNNIPYLEIKTSNYSQRYELCKMVTELYLHKNLPLDELQDIINTYEKENGGI